MRQDADTLAEPYWRAAYQVLLTQYKQVEKTAYNWMKELELEQKRADRYEEFWHNTEKQMEDLLIDYKARLRALGMSKNDIREFEEYWQRKMDPFAKYTDPDI